MKKEDCRGSDSVLAIAQQLQAMVTVFFFSVVSWTNPSARQTDSACSAYLHINKGRQWERKSTRAHSWRRAYHHERVVAAIPS